MHVIEETELVLHVLYCIDLFVDAPCDAGSLGPISAGYGPVSCHCPPDPRRSRAKQGAQHQPTHHRDAKGQDADGCCPPRQLSDGCKLSGCGVLGHVIGIDVFVIEVCGTQTRSRRVKGRE